MLVNFYPSAPLLGSNNFCFSNFYDSLFEQSS